LQQLLDLIHLETGSQCALVALVGLQGQGNEVLRFRRFATNLFNHWGVGSAQHNNGLLLMLFKEDRRLEIVTGTGMSTVLPDKWLSDMQHRCMVPHFRGGDHAAGLIAGVTEIKSRLATRAPQEWRSPPNRALEDSSGVALLPASHFNGGRTSDNSCFSELPIQRARNVGSGDTSWAMGLGALALLCTLIDGDKEQHLQQKLYCLLQKPVFKNADGIELAWPYAVAPGNIAGLRDICSQQDGLRHEAHAFVIAKKGLLKVQCRALGFGKRGLEVSLANPCSHSLTVELPAGSLFVADDTCRRVQPLITQELLKVELAPGEQRILLFDVFCGDSQGSVPRSSMTLTQYVVGKENLRSQRAVWHWSAPLQSSSGGASSPASEDFRTLEESFGISQQEASSMLEEFRAIATRSNTAREQEVSSLRQQIAEAREVRSTRGSLYSSGSRSSGGSSFGGGRSSGGGAGCSW